MLLTFKEQDVHRLVAHKHNTRTKTYKSTPAVFASCPPLSDRTMPARIEHKSRRSTLTIITALRHPPRPLKGPCPLHTRAPIRRFRISYK